MHRLTIIGLMLALISITPASVLVCGSVLSPELILQLNEGHDFDFEIDCAPHAAPINFSTLDFSSFMQSGFFVAVQMTLFLMAAVSYLFEDQTRRIIGCIVTPSTPPPTPFPL